MVQVQDITTRKRAEEHIHTLSQELIKAQENERQRLSRDLHDRLAQDLSTLKIGLDTFFYDQPDICVEKDKGFPNYPKWYREQSWMFGISLMIYVLPVWTSLDWLRPSAIIAKIFP